MTVMKTKTLARVILGAACIFTAPISVSAQESVIQPQAYIDVFQDGSLFITYEEYLERQRRVQAATSANQLVRPLAAPTRTAPVQSRVARSANTMALRDQWQIGAFR